MKEFYDKLNNEENKLLDNRIIKIKPMYYSLNKVNWNFDQKLKDKILNEKELYNNDEITNYIPFNFYDMNIDDKIDACLYFPCNCKNIKFHICHSSNCKFPFSKGSNYNESMFKDGLEIMDIPSNTLNGMEKRNKKFYNFDQVNNDLDNNRKIKDD